MIIFWWDITELAKIELNEIIKDALMMDFYCFEHHIF